MGVILVKPTDNRRSWAILWVRFLGLRGRIRFWPIFSHSRRVRSTMWNRVPSG